MTPAEPATAEEDATMQLGNGVRIWAALGAANGAVAVLAGAFAAHAIGDPRAVELIETGARWQVVSALAAVLAAGFSARIATILHVAGAALFGLSLYALAGGAPSIAGIVTPIGGVAMVGGWILLAVALVRTKL